MTPSTTIAAWLVGGAVMAFSAALAVAPRTDRPPADVISADPVPADTMIWAITELMLGKERIPRVEQL